MEFLITAIIATCVMTLAFFVSLKLNFFSLADAAWAYSFALIATVLFLAKPLIDSRILLLLMFAIWSVRLGWHLTHRLGLHFPTEDSRYVALKIKWKTELALRFGLFFVIQALSIVVLSLPVVLVLRSPVAQFGFLVYLSSALWLCGISGEALADNQLRRFRAQNHNQGKVCVGGLWQYSRHPNYFCEWLIWCAFGLFAFGVTLSPLSFVSPLVMFLLLNFISGVPIAEAQSLKSKGAQYAEYQKTTSRFFPWFPKTML